MSNLRRQLTLFVNNKFEIEKVRSKFNPIQYQLIEAHVTLCREDEIEDIETVIKNLNGIALQKPIEISFDSPITFDNGKGVLLPSSANNSEFDALRKLVLGIDFPRNHKAHITLMHSRNSTCTPEIFEEILGYSFPKQMHFDTVSLIEQVKDEKWKICATFKIAN